MATFDEQTVYAKHQSGCDCEDPSTCACDKSDCSCCPPGLVSVTDCDGNDLGCLTPKDAAAYTTQSHIPATGYVKVFDPITLCYLGDMTPQDAESYLKTVDPALAPTPAAGEFYTATTAGVSMNVALPASSNSFSLDYRIDRLTAVGICNISLSGSFPSGMTFLGGALSLEIADGYSVVSDGILIDDTVALGVYVLNVAYTIGTKTRIKSLTVNVV